MANEKKEKTASTQEDKKLKAAKAKEEKKKAEKAKKEKEKAKKKKKGGFDIKVLREIQTSQREKNIIAFYGDAKIGKFLLKGLLIYFKGGGG